LDFDGVLHPEPSDATEVFCRAPFLWEILEAHPNVDVVFSTSWRELFPVEVLVDFATRKGGEHLAGRFLGATPCLGIRDEYRCREIVNGAQFP